MGDIGQMFSDKSKKFKNIRSTILLKKVVNQIKSNGYYIKNIDINIITQTPKIKKYKKKMIDSISKLCEISKSQITKNWVFSVGDSRIAQSSILAHWVIL